MAFFRPRLPPDLAFRQGQERKNIAVHTNEKMTRNYEADHEDIVWTDAEADLDIEAIFK